jgi:hypothetical protein
MKIVAIRGDITHLDARKSSKRMPKDSIRMSEADIVPYFGSSLQYYQNFLGPRTVKRFLLVDLCSGQATNHRYLRSD